LVITQRLTKIRGAVQFYIVVIAISCKQREQNIKVREPNKEFIIRQNIT